MTHQSSTSADDRAWLDAMFADLQRQIDDLGGRLDMLTRLVHLHTVTALDGASQSKQGPANIDPQEACDGQP